jgi:hypothetical protein
MTLRYAALAAPAVRTAYEEAMSKARSRLLSGAENAYGFGLSAALVVPMGSAGEAGW